MESDSAVIQLSRDDRNDWPSAELSLSMVDLLISSDCYYPHSYCCISATADHTTISNIPLNSLYHWEHSDTKKVVDIIVRYSDRSAQSSSSI